MLKVLRYASFLCFMCAAFAAPRNDKWEVLGPGGGGSMYAPVFSPHDARYVIVSCDMTGTYLSTDGGDSWRMFNLRGRSLFYLFDPVDPNVIYVRTTALWRSTNRGKTWALVYPAPQSVKGVPMADDHAGERISSDAEPQGAPTALAVDPANNKVLFAAFRQGLYESTDWGTNWKKTADLPGGGQKIFVGPNSPKTNRTLYVVGRNSVAVREAGEWKTGEPLPGGGSLTDSSGGFPAAGGKLIVYAVSQGGAFVSDDGGQSWRKVAFQGISFQPRIPAVAASFLHPEVAYASYSTDRGSSERHYGVAKTTDAGRTWQIAWDETRLGPPHMREAWMIERNGANYGSNYQNLGVAPGDPDSCFGTDLMRTVRTKDGGKTWESIYSKRLEDGSYESTGLDVTTCYGLHFDPFDSQRVVISYTDIGQYRSDNGGRSWRLSTEGIPREWRNTTYWMVFDPEVKGRVWGVMSYVHDLPRPKMWRGRSFSTYRGGVCRSDDGARSWKCLPDAIPQTAPTHILLDPKSPANARVLYVAAFGRGVYKSTDDGATWKQMNNGIEGAEPLAWRFTMDRDGVLYLVCARRSDDGSIGNAFDGAIYRSTDGAEHWTKVALPKGVNGPNGLSVDPRDPRRLYLAAWGRQTSEGAVDGGIYVSNDTGATWQNVLAKDQHVYDVTIDPRDPKTLYACGFESSAWKSTDSGKTWRRLRGYNFKWGHRVIPDPNDRSKIYVTTFGGSVWHGPADGDPKAPEDIETPVLSFSGGR